HPSCTARRTMPAQQWVWPPAHHCVGAASVDKKEALGLGHCASWLHNFLKRFCGLLRPGHMHHEPDQLLSWWDKWGARIMNIIRIAGLASLGFAVLVEPAFAGNGPVRRGF